MISLRIFRIQSKTAIFITGLLATCLCFSYVALRCDIISDKDSTSTFCGFDTNSLRAIFEVNIGEKPLRNSSGESKDDRILDEPMALHQEPIKHLVFLKVHKAGSSTILNIVYRFGVKHKLIFALPKGGNYFNHVSKEFNPSRVEPIPKGFQYDVLCNHAIYNRTIFRPLFQNDTFYFSILRQPFLQFLSASRYFGLTRRKDLQIANPYRKYLLNRKYFKYPLGYDFYDNRMSFDLGLEPKYFHDIPKIREFIEILDKDFQLMLIAEYFDESLVLLRRYLSWTMKDIISFRLNVNRNRSNYTFSAEDFTLHRKQTTADYMLYDHYLKIFWERVAQEGPSFFNELTIYKKVRGLMETFCTNFGFKIESSASASQWKKPFTKSKRDTKLQTELSVPASQWNEAFNLTTKDCTLFTKKELSFLAYIRQEQTRRFYKNNLFSKLKNSQNNKKTH